MKKGDEREAGREARIRAARRKEREAGRNNFAVGRFRFKLCFKELRKRKN